MTSKPSRPPGEGERRGGVPSGDLARQRRVLDQERALQVGRGVHLRSRRRVARGIQGDRRCRAFAADRRSPAGDPIRHRRQACRSPTTANGPSCGSRRSIMRCAACRRIASGFTPATASTWAAHQRCRVEERHRHHLQDPGRRSIRSRRRIRATSTNGRSGGPSTSPETRFPIPGVITHSTVLVEHPELVCDRILRFAQIVGRERVIAGADCGFGTFAGVMTIHPTIAWAKPKPGGGHQAGERAVGTGGGLMAPCPGRARAFGARHPDPGTITQLNEYCAPNIARSMQVVLLDLHES